MIHQCSLKCFLLFVFCSVLNANSVQALVGTLLVANREAGSLSFIDFPTRAEIARIPIGPVIPHEVDVSPDGTQALTSEYGTGELPGQHLLLIDIREAKLLKRIDIGSKSRPHTALFLPDGMRAVATMEDSDQLGLIDLEAGKVIKTYPTGGREGHMVRLSPDGARAYVTSRKGSGTLSVINLVHDEDPVVIQTGAGAEGLAVHPKGSVVWVANRMEETISVIDTKSLGIIDTIDSRLYAGRIEMSRDGRFAIVPNGSSAGEVPNFLRLYDVDKRELVTEVPIRDGTPQIGFFGILIVEDRVFATDPRKGTMQTYNLDGLDDRQYLLKDHEMPDGMAWSPVRVNVMESE